MLYRKIASSIEKHFKKNPDKILLIDGARQVGKTYIIRHVAKKLFPNFIEINMAEDNENDKLFKTVSSTADFYLRVSAIHGDKMKDKKSTVIFIDEIQVYPSLLTLLKFLQQEGKFTYIASGSMLGIALSETPSIPMGSITTMRMYPLDFEEFLLATGANEYYISSLSEKFKSLETPDETTHNSLMRSFKRYLLVGGLPAAINAYVETHNVQLFRSIQSETHEYYGKDASKYDEENKLKIRKIYDMIPSNLENKKKRIIVQHIEGQRGKTYSDYKSEFEYLISAGITLDVQAVSAPVFPLLQSAGKNLLKLYLNDVGIFTGLLYGNNMNAILNDENGINLGSVYEAVVASELKAHGFKLFYYDNRSKGEVDFLIDDYDSLSVVPLEIKSGKDYAIHSALNTFVSNPDYHIKKAYVLSNGRNVATKNGITYIPIYYVMFFKPNQEDNVYLD